MSSTVVEYEKVNVDPLLYSRNPKIISSILRRDPTRYYPKGARTDLQKGSTLEFEIHHDMLVDLCSAALSFDLELTGATDGHVPIIANAIDIVDRVQLYYNESNIESITEVSSWSNALLAYSANADYVNSEGSVFLGLTNKLSIPAATDITNKSRRYVVPMCLLSPFFMAHNYLPLINNRLRITINIQNEIKKVIANFKTGESFTIKNVNLLMDSIIVNQEYIKKIQMAMADPVGFRFPYTSYTTGILNCTGSSNENLQINNVHTSALSLLLLYDNKAAKDAVAVDGTKHIMWNQSFPLSSFESLFIKSGSRVFTPYDRIQGHAEAYASTEKCITSFCNLGSSGWISFLDYTKPYSDAAVTNAATSKPLCLLGVNLERAIVNDFDVINLGLNAKEATNQFDVEIKTTTGSTANGDNWLYNIVHKRWLIFNNSSYNVEY